MLSMFLILLSGCSSNSNAVDADPFQYKDAYIGDNSAVVNTLMHLQGADHFSGFELQTKEEPYGMTVSYDWTESELNPKETAINNTSYLFALIQNADWVTFHFETVAGAEEYKITREELRAGYDMDLRAIEDEGELKGYIEELIADETNVNALLDEG